ncbi:cytochrome P450 [Aspergillus stella-maris]|uniref:cytochrome P450 n=1 Tax=Aspergillus stella-maris TaxID=1810926 RepID=UPI003CCD2D33
MLLVFAALATLAVVTVVLLIRRQFPGLRAPGLPPGPPCLPIIGNLHQLPKTGSHLKFTQWQYTYGPIFSVKLGPQTLVVLNSPYLVKQLIDKQSANFSDRPKSYIADNLILHHDHLMFLGPDARWRRGRKLYHQFFNEPLCENNYHHLQNAEGSQLLRDLCDSPDDFMGHCKRYSNSIIMSLVTGIRTPTPAADHMEALYTVLDGFSEIFEMGATPPVDIFPFFAWIPQRFFNNWKSRAVEIAKTMDSVYGPLVDRVIRRREQSKFLKKESYLDIILDQQEKLQLTRHEIDLMVGNLLEGGSDTTAITLLAFVQAMALYPEIQARAREEIDQAIGAERSPTWNEYATLPYITMIIKETMRWRPVMPTAFPHATSKECTIDGMSIPAGSTVIMNVWGLHHDNSIHNNPDQFNPSRYDGRTELANVYASSPDYKNRDHYGYGAGRRICPGIHLAERGLFIAIAKILWAFEITPKVDSTGIPIPISCDPPTGYSDGFLRCPLPFAVDFKLRSGERGQTIRAEFARAEEGVFSHYEI